MKRRWLFRVRDENGDEHYVGPEGENRDCEVPFVGTDSEASVEASQRAYLWENQPGNGFPVRITYESRGVMK